MKAQALIPGTLDERQDYILQPIARYCTHKQFQVAHPPTSKVFRKWEKTEEPTRNSGKYGENKEKVLLYTRLQLLNSPRSLLSEDSNFSGNGACNFELFKRSLWAVMFILSHHF